MDERQKELYRSIAAPEGLRERALAGKVRPRRRVGRTALKSFLPAAACLFLTVSAMLLSVGRGSPPALSLNGTAITTEAVAVSAAAPANLQVRAAAFAVEEAPVPEAFELPLVLAVEGEAEVSVSTGTLRLDSGEEGELLTVSGEASVVWSVPAITQEETAELCVVWHGEERVYRLAYDGVSECWSFQEDN